MSPGFRNVLRLARIPVDSSEPVRKIWQPADWHCDGMSASASGFRRSAVGFHFVAGHLGAGVYIGLSLAGDKSLNR